LPPQASPERPSAPTTPARLAPSELAFLRFVAGIRALLATLSGIVLLASSSPHWGLNLAAMLLYLAWAGVLLWRTLHGWSRAASRVWLWLDAAGVLVISQLVADTLPLFGIFTVLPVVALAVLAGAVPAMALAVACAAAMLALTGSLPSLASLPPLPLSVPIIVLAFGPAAALLARPSRELRERLKLIDTLNERSDPRQGLGHHVDMLLQQLATHFELRNATISLQGPEPRVFQWQSGARTAELAEPGASIWRQRLAALPRDLGCICTASGSAAPSFVAFNISTGSQSKTLGDDARRALQGIGAQAVALPLLSYGQPLGTLCLRRADPAFTVAELRWLDDVMRETMPLLERSDLLEQLQRETASRERERIGRDLHDSAVQPYLGLKYGLEALARQAGPTNPVAHHIQQLVHMASQELQTLRDVISGLRRGETLDQADSAPLAALQREAQRFESLYGLKVHVFAPHAPRLRGAAAKAVLHMVNEALTNARRHTNATAVTVLLDVTQSDVVVRIRNDHGHEDALPPDFLPRSLTERATDLGGAVEITHQPDFTEIAITLPLLGSIG
jgi:signal transduction histidine kinase